jgi:hypothetical protein
MSLVERELLEHYGCCGRTIRDGSISPRWNESTHDCLVNRAANLLQEPAALALRSPRVFVHAFWRNESFRNQLFMGLHDADKCDPWIKPSYDGKPTQAMFAAHFYDPHTKTSMPIAHQNGWYVTAVSEGTRYFDLAVEAARRILRLGSEAPPELYAQAGDYLGLALHFLTDLTQPMHAATFAVIVGEGTFPDENEWRHTAFEAYAEAYVKKVKYPPLDPLTVTDEVLSAIPTAAPIFVQTAVHSKQIWRNGLRDRTLATAKPRGPFDSKVDSYLDDAFRPAPGRVAQLLAYFAYCARWDIEALGVRRRRWYALMAPQRHVLGVGPDDVIVRRESVDDRGLVTFVYDSQGRCAVVPRHQRKQSWTREPESLNTKLRSTGSTAEETRFRVVPRMDGSLVLYSSARIRTSGAKAEGDQALTVQKVAAPVLMDRQHQGWVQPDGQPLYPEDHGALTPAELSDIHRRPNDGQGLPWWGTPGGPPAWRGTWRSAMDRPAGSVTTMAMVSTGSGLLHLFALIGGVLYRRDWIGFWDAWQRVPHPPGPFSAAIAAVASPFGYPHLFVAGSGAARGLIHHGPSIRDTSFWRTIPAPNSPPVCLAACLHDGILDLFATTSSGRLLRYRTMLFLPGAWHDVTPRDAAPYNSAISATAFGPDLVNVVDVTRSAVRQTWFSPVRGFRVFDKPFDLRHALITTWDDNQPVITAIAGDGTVALRYFTGEWGPWQIGSKSTGQVGDAACAASWGSFRLDAIVTDSAGNIRPRAYC